MDGIELTALYTLQHGLARDPQDFGRILHRHITLGGVFDEARAQLLGDSDLPRSTGRDLLTGDKPVVEPTMDRRRRDAKDIGCLLDVDQFTF